MADRYSPVKLSLGNSGTVRCASNRKYAVVQLVNNEKWRQGNGQPLHRPKVLFRSDKAKYIADKVRTLGGWSFVFELQEGALLWQNSSSEWLTAEQAIQNYESRSK
jgi:hypothetical protein